MRRAALILAALLAAPAARAQYSEPEVRALSERLFGPVPRDAATVLHMLPWGARPPVAATTHVLVAQDSRIALVGLIAMLETAGSPPVPHALLLGEAGDPAQCEIPPGMPEGAALDEFSAPREGDSGLTQPIVTLTGADGVGLIGLTWRMGERGNAAQALALFRQDGARLVEVACVVTRLDATVTMESTREDGPVRRRRVSIVWRVEPGPDAATPLQMRDTARQRLRPVPLRLNPETGRYAIVRPPEREDAARR